ncbi:hypothetical protein AM593_07450, partial [Mytilus galloprovincialis]
MRPKCHRHHKIFLDGLFLISEESLDETDSEVQANDIIKKGEPNTDDIFVVSNYPRIVQQDKGVGLILVYKSKFGMTSIITELVIGDHNLPIVVDAQGSSNLQQWPASLITENLEIVNLNEFIIFLTLDLLANECLSQAVIPVLTDTGKNSGMVEKKTVAQMVLLKYSEEKGLYFFPGLEIPANDFKSIEPVDFSASMSGNLVTTAS